MTWRGHVETLIGRTLFWLVVGVDRVHRRFGAGEIDDDQAGEDEALRALEQWRVTR